MTRSARLLGELAVRKGFLEPGEVERIRRHLEEATAAGRRVGFLEAALELGSLSPEHAQELRAAVGTMRGPALSGEDAVGVDPDAGRSPAFHFSGGPAQVAGSGLPRIPGYEIVERI